MQCTNSCVSMIYSCTVEISVQVDREYALQSMAGILRVEIAVFSGHGRDGA